VASGFGVCANSGDLIVAIKIKVKKNLIIAGDAEYLRRFFPAEAFDNFPALIWRNSGRRSSTCHRSNQRSAKWRSLCRSWLG
jgi:hypothetical protein